VSNHPQESIGRKVRCFNSIGPGMTIHEGQVVAYCTAPTFLIQVGDRRIFWRVDMTEFIEKEQGK
jgi:hypothetical protein